MTTENRCPDAAGPDAAHPGRRDFLKAAAGLPAALLAARAALAGDPAPAGEAKLPRVPFGKHTISRLVCGANPFNAGSHLSVFVNQEMKAYFTPEQILKTLRRCEEVGIDLWQANDLHYQLYRRLVAEGSAMKYITLGSEKGPSIEAVKEAGGIGIAHHGEVTDQRFKTGKLDSIRDYLKGVRDAGLLVGVSTHMPAVVEEIESRGWDLDFYMTCVYERHRSAAELEKLLGQAPIPAGEVYLPGDPPRMFKAIRATKRTCLAFKILAAGRLSERRDWVEEAFRQTFASIKPTDAVIIGIWDKYADQQADDAEMTRRFGKA
jgi:hypothetical protein